MPHRRNLLVVLTHGLRSDALADARAWPVLTPNLEGLAKRGLRLVAGSACPAQWGGMASVISGLHARQHGYITQAPAPEPPPHVAGWPQWLVEQGYHVAGVGCVGMIEPWLDQAVVVDSVDHVESDRCAYLRFAHEEGYQKAVSAQRRQRLRYGPFEPDRLLLQPDQDIDGFIYNQARKLLVELPQDHAWALVVAFSGPANDLPPPVMYADAVDPALLETGFALADFTKLDAVMELDYPRVQLQRLTPQRVARLRADYLGRVTLIDFGIGRLSAALAKRRDRERTWTVVAGDHGMLLGEHGLIGRRSFHAPALHTPLLVTPPRLARQPVYDTGLISTVDVAPTLADIAGCDIPKACAGRSLLPLLRHHDTPTPLSMGGGLLSELGAKLMLETERFKIVFHTESHEALVMYDLLNDPDEKKNLIRDKTGMNLVDSLRWRLADALLPLRAPAAVIPYTGEPQV